MSDYAKGFKDGFAAGLEEGKKLSQPKPQPDLGDYVFGSRTTCPKCGIKIDGVMGYVCSSINCPTFYNTSSYGSLDNEMTSGWDIGSSKDWRAKGYW